MGNDGFKRPIVSSHQPNFMPYMGFFYKMYRSDILALSYDVLFSKSGRHNWNTYKSSNGPKKMTLPVHAHHDNTLAEIILSKYEESITKLSKSLKQEYSKARHFEEGCVIIDSMLEIADRCDGRMADFNCEIIRLIAAMMNIGTKIVKTTELGICGKKDERIIQICCKLSAGTYMSGEGARVYHVEEKFKDNGIDLEYTGFSPLYYDQLHGDFISNLSVIDYIFNEGFKLPEVW